MQKVTNYHCHLVKKFTSSRKLYLKRNYFAFLKVNSILNTIPNSRSPIALRARYERVQQEHLTAAPPKKDLYSEFQFHLSDIHDVCCGAVFQLKFMGYHFERTNTPFRRRCSQHRRRQRTLKQDNNSNNYVKLQQFHKTCQTTTIWTTFNNEFANCCNLKRRAQWKNTKKRGHVSGGGARGEKSLPK